MSAQAWNIFIDQDYVGNPQAYFSPDDSLGSVIERVIIQQQLEGYYFVQLDSVRIDENGTPTNTSLYFTNGPRSKISQIKIQGASVVDENDLLDLLDVRTGDVLMPGELDADIERILTYYGGKGYHFAKVWIDDLRLAEQSEEEYGLEITLSVEEGNQVQINDIMFLGAKRTRSSYLEYIMGIESGEKLNADLEAVQLSLEASRLFSVVSPVELIHVGGEEYIVLVSVEEEQPGAFDLVLGYQPPNASGNNNGLVGNGHLDLRNPFGLGRRIGLKLNRLLGQVSSVNVNYADSYFFGSAFSIEAGFQGIQQDSTFNQQSLKGAVGYRFLDGLEMFATINRETTRPGQSGLQFVQDTQRIPRSEITFWGFEVRYNRVDRPQNPRRGLRVETTLESGLKQRSSFERTPAGDTTTVSTRISQQRMDVLFRTYLPVLPGQVLVIGNDSRILVSEDFDVSDLFRLGGAQSLRGYDEDRFLGRIVSRSLLEWRYLFERTSYAYLFFDLGYIDRPGTIDFQSLRGWFPGYGLGIQFETGIGLINTSLALSTTDAPSQAKVHVGLSLGL